MPQRLRVFISSPGDVPDERLRADLIIDKLSQEFSRYFSLEGYRWEHEPMLASGHFQDAIEPPSTMDIVLLILWSRLGTPLPQSTEGREYRGLDGRAPVTGTEWEFEDALAAARSRGAPDILVFRNVSPAPIDPRDPSARARSLSQLDALDDFWKRHFADRGMFLAAFDEYRTLEEFAERFEESLRKLIERRVKTAAAVAATDEPLWAGNPFRGLQAYEFEHAPIFFGRDAMVAKGAEHLAAQARAGTAFLLVCGASGSGKSSLVKAAIVPRLMKPQRIAGAAFLRRAVFRPGDSPGDLMLGLVEAITRGPAADGLGLPELLAAGQKPADLATLLRQAAGAPGFVFANALSALTERERAAKRILAYEEAKLILVIDQFEELFTLGAVNAEDRLTFIRLIAGLARSGAVWIVATMRADFWHRAAEVSELVALTEGQGRLDVPPPSPAELAEMIRKPAVASGLSFEMHPETGLGLDAVLAEHASAAPGVLPLLSFTLDALYAEDVQKQGGRILTYQTYDQLGGLEGAIATRADAVVAGLPADVQAAVPRVLRMLTTVGGVEQVPVARSVPLVSFPDGGPTRAVVDALTEARLLVASTEGMTPIVRLAHEALITRWDRAREQLAADRRDLETRALVERQFGRWRIADGAVKRQLLLRDPDLAVALDLKRRWGDEIDAETGSFIAASRQRARLRYQVTAAIAAVFGVVAITASVLGVVAYRAQQQADLERTRAEANYTAAKGTVDSLIFDVAQGLRAVEGMRIGTVEKVLDRVRETVEQLAVANRNDPGLERTRGIMLNEFAGTYATKGDLTRALKHAEDSLAIARALVARAPDNATYRRDLSVRLDTLAEIKLQTGDTAAARAAFQESLTIRRALSAAAPDDLTLQRAVAVSLEKMGDMALRAGDAGAAAKAYDEALDLRRRALARNSDPKSAHQWERGIAVVYSKIGNLKLREGDTGAAMKAYQDALDIGRKLAAADPDNTDWQRDVAVDLNKIAVVKMRIGDTAGAIAAYSEQLAIVRGLAAKDPDNTQWQQDISFALEWLADAKAQVGDRAAALKHYEESLSIRRRLASRDPENAEWQGDVARALDRLGDFRFLTGDQAGVNEAYAEALTIRRRLSARDPENTYWLEAISISLNKIGDYKLQARDAKGAAAAYEEALTIRRKLVARDPASADWRRNLAIGLNKVGDVKAQVGDLSGALAAYEEALGLMRALIATNPNNTEWQRDASVLLERIGGLKLQSGDVKGALAARQEALDIARRLVARAPDNSGWQRDLSVSLSLVASAKKLAGDAAGALKDYEEALAIRRKLAARDPDNVLWKRDIAVVLGAIGDLKLAGRDYAGTVAPYGEALQIQQALVARDPSNTLWQRDYSIGLERFADLKLALGDAKGAATLLEQSLAITRRLAAAAGESAERQHDLSLGLNKLGDVRLKAGDAAGALAVFTEGLELRRRLAADKPGNAKARNELVSSLIRVGDAQLKLKVPAEAAKSYAEALSMSRKLAADEPDNGAWRQLVATSLQHLGNAKHAAGDIDGAVAAYEEAVGILRRAYAAEPDNTSAATNLVAALINLATTRQGRGDAAGAKPVFEEVLGVLDGLERAKTILPVQRELAKMIRQLLRASASVAPVPVEDRP